MFEEIKKQFINFITSRIFILIIVFILLSSLLIYRIFYLQIVKGEEYSDTFRLKIEKQRTIPSTRGKIYDRNGYLLAYNELAYSIMIEDVYEASSTKNHEINQTLKQVVEILESNNDKIINDFKIVINENNEFEYIVSGDQLLRFLAYIYGKSYITKGDEDNHLSYEESTKTPDEVIHYLANNKKFGIGEYTDPDTFEVGLGYTKQELLEIVNIRYSMNLNSYRKYIPTKIATEVSEQSIAMIMENANNLMGVSVSEDTIRKYEDSIYFSHIIGYTGRVSQADLDQLSEEEKDNYDINDGAIGKAGIEKEMENELHGKNGRDMLAVDSVGKTMETRRLVDPIAGHDLYLSIDAQLQKSVYSIIEQKLAGILVDKIKNIKTFTLGENAKESSIQIPIDDVYYALIENNIIDILHFNSATAKETEQEVYKKFQVKKDTVFENLKEELLVTKTPYKDLEQEYRIYQSYIVNMLMSSNKGIIMNSKIDKEDPTYIAWVKDETISMNEYLMYAISMNWIDVTKLELENNYSDTEEVYEKLVSYIFESLSNDATFFRKIYKYMIQENSLTGKEICLLLWEQSIIDIPIEKINALQSNEITAYDFMIDRIENLDITPAQLALDPCSGSAVVTDINTGSVLAMVTYPSYDNNRLANSIDAEYFKEINEDLSSPMWDYATQQKTAPGSTFKMVSTLAGLEEGVILPSTKLLCNGAFYKFDVPVKCWIYPGAHGSLSINNALGKSCNSYFYEFAYRLGLEGNTYNSEIGIEKLAYWADQLGLTETSGVEVMESVPEVSDTDAVRSAIGQGNHNYTTVGLARYVTTVANGGTCFDLSLLDKLYDAQGNLIEVFTPEIRNMVPADSSSWDVIHEGMGIMVSNSSTFSKLQIDAAGKTGTAQQTSGRADHALFVGFAPLENPEISIAVRIANGYTSSNAAEIARDVFSYYFELEEKDVIISSTAQRPDTQTIIGD